MGKLLKNLGPGLLFAGAAIGVSHLVQSTRAGAMFGLDLIWAILIANIIKYPAFEAGPRYVAATGESLLDGYKKLGTWAVWLFFFMTVGTMFIIQAAVSIVTGGLLTQLISTSLTAPMLSFIVLLICSLILLLGRYSLLDKLGKIVVITLTISTIITLALGFSKTEIAVGGESFNFGVKGHLFFLVALVGWMPAPLDISVWHSMWSMAKRRQQKGEYSLGSALLDFRVGHIGAAFLALAFLFLGALTMYGSGQSFSPSAAKFSGQLVNLYTKNIGSWAFPLIAIAAFTTMFSTTLTCLDAFARVLRRTTILLFEPFKNEDSSRVYNFWMLVTVIGSSIILFSYLKNMKAMVDLATTISFVMTPIFALLNYKVITSKEIQGEMRISRSMKYAHHFGIVVMVTFALYYLVIRFS